MRDASYAESPEGERTLAALVDDSGIVLVRFGDEGVPALETLPPRGQIVTHVRLGRNAELLAATATGRLQHWDISGERAQLTETVKVSDVDITALEYGLFDLERLERLILRTIAKDYFVLPGGPDTDDDDE